MTKFPLEKLGPLLLIGSVLWMAGCLEAGDEATLERSTDEPISTVVVEPEPGVKVASNRGVLRGIVRNDAGFGLKDARVLILQTERFADTKSDGKFLFENVTVGSHFVRVEAKGFRAFENQTHVTAGNITELDILMIPLQSTGAGYLPHLHDFWAGREQVDILDHDYDFTQPEKTSGIAGPVTYRPSAMVLWGNTNSSNGDMRVRFPDDGTPRLIFPGTKEVHVTVSWSSSASTMTKVALKYRAPGTSQDVHGGRQPNGHTWKFPVAPERWDTGHQRYTLWGFWINPYQDPLQDGAGYRPGVMVGALHVKVTVFKGDLLPEGAHENFWESGDQLLLRDHAFAECNSAYRIIERSRQHCEVSISGQPIRIVPPGTGKLLVEMQWRYYQADGTAPSDLTAMYRTGAQDRWTTRIAEFNIATCQSTAAMSRSCEIPVKPGETDGFYQRSSVWGFTYGVKGAEKEEFDREVRNLQLSFKIIAVKDPSYVGGGEA